MSHTLSRSRWPREDRPEGQQLQGPGSESRTLQSTKSRLSQARCLSSPAHLSPHLCTPILMPLQPWGPEWKGTVITRNHLPNPDSAFNKSCELLNSLFLSDSKQIFRKNRKKQLTFLNPKVTGKFGNDTFSMGLKLENRLMKRAMGILCQRKPVPWQNLLWRSLWPEPRCQGPQTNRGCGRRVCA